MKKYNITINGVTSSFEAAGCVSVQDPDTEEYYDDVLQFEIDNDEDCKELAKEQFDNVLTYQNSVASCGHSAYVSIGLPKGGKYSVYSQIESGGSAPAVGVSEMES